MPGYGYGIAEVLTSNPASGGGTPPFEYTAIANNYSMTFDGTNYIDTGISTEAQLQTISVSAWFKETQIALANTVIVANNGSTNKGWAIWIDNNVMRWQVADGSNTSWNDTVVLAFRTYAPLNQWNHVCCTFDGSNSYIYINGQLRETWAVTPTPYTVDYSGNVGNLTIGRRSFSSSGFYNGSLDEVAFWNTDLSEDTIEKIYNTTNDNPGKVANLTETPEGAPIAWYRFE